MYTWIKLFNSFSAFPWVKKVWLNLLVTFPFTPPKIVWVLKPLILPSVSAPILFATLLVIEFKAFSLFIFALFVANFVKNAATAVPATVSAGPNWFTKPNKSAIKSLAPFIALLPLVSDA